MPSANMFLHLTTALLSSPVSLSASRVIDVMSGMTTLYSFSSSSAIGSSVANPAFLRCSSVIESPSMITVAPCLSHLRLALSAAGFMATSTSQ